MITSYMNQSAVLKVKGSVDEFNQPTYAADVTIDCRIDYARKMVRNSTGQEIVSEATLFTTTRVRPDDVIVFDGTNWTVLVVADQAGLSGTIEFYEVSL